MQQIRSVVLLGGAVRKTSLASATARSILDLPLEPNSTFVDHWQTQIADLASHVGFSDIPVRLMLDSSAPRPVMPREDSRVRFRVESDPRPLRGTGGLLRDLSESYDAEDYMLVANAAQVLLEPLPDLASAMAATASDICVVSHTDGTPSGIMLVKCSCLRKIPEIGFVDMKEQGLPLISKSHRASVVYREVPCGLPVLNLENYIFALRWYHRYRGGESLARARDPFAEDWDTSFSIVEAGSTVHESVRLHDAVVLRGGKVEPGAFVARSIVCPGGFVDRDQTVVSELVTCA